MSTDDRELIGHIPAEPGNALSAPIPVYGIRCRPDPYGEHPTWRAALQVEFQAGARTISTDGDIYLYVHDCESSHFGDVITWSTYEVLLHFQREITIAGAMARRWVADDELKMLGVAQAA